ncbi:MAG: NAD(P)-binding protein [Bacilli bacterium]|nr:NAD(P)-binding protein [Bacilli bacterium]
MIRVRQIKVGVLEDSQEVLLKKISQKLKINVSDILFYEIRKKSIDARDKENIIYVYEFNVKVKEEGKVLKKITSPDIFLWDEKEYTFPKPPEGIPLIKQPIIVGSGPAGLFCAYFLAEAGYCPRIFERGDSMEERIQSVEEFFKGGVLDPNSNVQFGEGGAGTFSDGKLNSLVKDKMGRMRKIFEIFVENGAPEEILYMHNPHIGTDLLRNVIISIRKKILSMGGEFHYRSCVTNLLISHDQITGIEVNHKELYSSNCVILAIGHSARDTFQMLHENGILMKPKNFAVGVRVEHPRSMIDTWQYGKFASTLGAAPYKLTYQTKSGRGVYSFCMCPGGFVVNASSEEEGIVVNGMSNYNRDEANSNSAIVVSISPEDLGGELFSGMEFQRQLEQAAYREGNGLIPVQLYKDFKKNQVSTGYGSFSSNTMGSAFFGNLRNVLPPFISESILEAMPEFGKKIHGFDREDTIFLGVETRTSSPVVIERDEHYMSSIKGLYPCGEGAGYAGGITTSAIDGLKVAEEIVLNS